MKSMLHIYVQRSICFMVFLCHFEIFNFDAEFCFVFLILFEKLTTRCSFSGTVVEDLNKRRQPLPALDAVYFIQPSHDR